MPYTPIVGTLGYVLSKDKKRVLQVFRSFNKNDDHLGKYNGLGGKLEKGEDVLSGMKRELFEEAGISATKLELRGTINWTGFGKKGEDWLGFIFLIHEYEGEVFKESPEGPLSWEKIEDIPSLPIWEGDKYYLPLVFDKNPIPFHGIMPYKNDKPLSWEFSR